MATPATRQQSIKKRGEANDELLRPFFELSMIRCNERNVINLEEPVKVGHRNGHRRRTSVSLVVEGKAGV